MQYQLGKDIQDILSRLERLEFKVNSLFGHRFTEGPGGIPIIDREVARVVESEEVEVKTDGRAESANPPQFLNLEGEYKRIAHPTGHTFFSFRVNRHNSSDTRDEFGRIIIDKGSKLHGDGLTQDYGKGFIVTSVRIQLNQVLCVCTFRPPAFVNFLTLSWIPNTGVGGTGATLVRRMDGREESYPDFVEIPAVSADGTRYATFNFRDRNL